MSFAVMAAATSSKQKSPSSLAICETKTTCRSRSPSSFLSSARVSGLFLSSSSSASTVSKASSMIYGLSDCIDCSLSHGHPFSPRSVRITSSSFLMFSVSIIFSEKFSKSLDVAVFLKLDYPLYHLFFRYPLKRDEFFSLFSEFPA